MIIVTGHNGNLGTILANQLQEKGISVFPKSRLEITDKKAIQSFFKGLKEKPWAVFHCAALTNIAETEKNPEKTMLVNETGTRLLLEVIAEEKLKPWFCYLSTSHVYKYKPEPSLLTEKDEVAPRSNYAQSKLQGEEVARQICERENIPLMVARVFSYYSTLQKESFVVPRLAGLVAKAKKGEVVKTGWLSAKRDFLDATDVARALILAMESSTTGVVNVCSGKTIAIKDIFDTFVAIRRESEKDFSITLEEGQPRLDDVPWIGGSPLKLEQFLSFEPRLTLKDGLRKIWETKNS